MVLLYGADLRRGKKASSPAPRGGRHSRDAGGRVVAASGAGQSLYRRREADVIAGEPVATVWLAALRNFSRRAELRLAVDKPGTLCLNQGPQRHSEQHRFPTLAPSSSPPCSNGRNLPRCGRSGHLHLNPLPVLIRRMARVGHNCESVAIARCASHWRLQLLRRRPVWRGIGSLSRGRRAGLWTAAWQPWSVRCGGAPA